jgi:2-(1,2-epoxy-1,2-dihydrophenyl)acetyl-CoA isomerase
MIRTDQQNGIATITLDRPEALNALNTDMMQRMLDAVRTLGAHPDTRVLVITAVGRAFSAGGDVKKFSALLADNDSTQAACQLADGMEDVGNPLCAAIANAPVPVLTAVNGACAGGAVGLALAADVTIAARSAYFMVPQVTQLSIVPDLGMTWLLARALGRSRALGMSLLGERISAEQAQASGLIWACVDDNELAPQTRAIAERLGGLSAEAVVATRRLTDEATMTSLSRQLAEERNAQRMLLARPRFGENVERFVGRTKNPKAGKPA